VTEFALRADDLTRDFGSVRALDHLSLEVRRGILFGFLGPNGAGKTTAIRAFLGLIDPTSGRAEVLGMDTRRDGDAIRARCGALLEHSGLYERLSAQDNLEFYGRVWHIPLAARRARIKELLEGIGLWDRRRELVGQWSRGMKQKLAVARAVLHHPELIFLDEPTAGLDPVASAALRDDLAALAAREGVTIFLTTHNLPEAERLCTEVGVIRGGRLVAVGSPTSLRADRGGARIEIEATGVTQELMAALQSRAEVEHAQANNGTIALTLRDGMRVAPIVAMLVESGAAIEEVRKVRPSLEASFLELMEGARISPEGTLDA
jgi:ABC-2 type transport system ATP-binding protein